MSLILQCPFVMIKNTSQRSKKISTTQHQCQLPCPGNTEQFHPEKCVIKGLQQLTILRISRSFQTNTSISVSVLLFLRRHLLKAYTITTRPVKMLKENLRLRKMSNTLIIGMPLAILINEQRQVRIGCLNKLNQTGSWGHTLPTES